MKKEIDVRGKGVNTPWGIADWCVNYAVGIDSFCTPGHGGFRLSAVRRMQMPAGLREFVGYGGPGWYEEDCDWAVVALAFPSLFEPMAVWGAIRTVKGFSGPYGADVKEWLYTPAANDAWFIANKFEREQAKKFTRGCEGTSSEMGYSWFIDARTVNGEESAVFLFNEVPSLPSPFTREDVATAGGIERMREPVRVAVQFNENDCGGAFDGVNVTSDADPGL